MPPTIADELPIFNVCTGGFEALPTNIDMQFDTLSQLDRSLIYRYSCSTIELWLQVTTDTSSHPFGGLIVLWAGGLTTCCHLKRGGWCRSSWEGKEVWLQLVSMGNSADSSWGILTRIAHTLIFRLGNSQYFGITISLIKTWCEGKVSLTRLSLSAATRSAPMRRQGLGFHRFSSL